MRSCRSKVAAMRTIKWKQPKGGELAHSGVGSDGYRFILFQKQQCVSIEVLGETAKRCAETLDGYSCAGTLAEAKSWCERWERGLIIDRQPTALYMRQRRAAQAIREGRLPGRHGWISGKARK